MAVLDSCPKPNMVAYLEKTDGNTEFHKIISFLTQSSIHYALIVIAGKPVSISEASIRSDLLFDDADGIDSLPNQAIFDGSGGNHGARRYEPRRMLKLAVADRVKRWTSRSRGVVDRTKDRGSDDYKWRKDLNHDSAFKRYTEDEEKKFKQFCLGNNKYPLKKEVLSQLLKLKLETDEDSTMALELIRFVKKQIAELEPKESDGDEKDL
ncbi:hypothetical protein Tco_0743381 [Tanacetum coccineum]